MTKKGTNKCDKIRKGIVHGSMTRDVEKAKNGFR